MEIKTEITMSGTEMKAILTEHVRKTTGKEVEELLWRASRTIEEREKYGNLIITIQCIEPAPALPDKINERNIQPNL